MTRSPLRVAAAGPVLQVDGGGAGGIGTIGGVSTDRDPRAPEPHHDPDETPRTRRSPFVTVIAVVVVLAIAASLIISVPGAFAGSDDEPVSIPAVASPEQDRPGGALGEQTQDGIRSAIEGSSAGASGVMVIDPASEEVLFAEGEGEDLVPASNQKILTLFALLSSTGPDERLATAAVTGETANDVVLVAGGDTLLSPGRGDPESVVGRAGIEDLAASTAEAMAEDVDPEQPVRVAVDTSIFSGPELNPAWEDGDIEAQEIGAIAPMAFDSHRVPGEDGAYDDDPVASVSEAFQTQLAEQLGERIGQDVEIESAGEADTGADPMLPADQQEGVTELARVESAPVQEQAGVMMRESDNRLAEALGRVAAVSAGSDGSVEGVQQTLRESVIEALGREAADGLSVVDASGMTLDNRVSAEVLGGLLRIAAADETGRFSPMIGAFPVGGVSGTLAERFDDPDETQARAVTRAKTGTLNVVTALSGQTIRPSGHPVVLVVLLDEVEEPDAARDAADRIYALVAADGA